MRRLRHILILYSVIIALVTALMYNACTNAKRTSIEVEIPEIEGVLKDESPLEVEKDSIFIYELRDTIVKYTNPIDTVYITKYLEMTSEEQEVAYADAVKYRTYESIVEDDTLSLSYTANTQGKLLDIKFDYRIKPRSLNIPVNSTNVSSLYGGFGMKSTTSLDNLTPTVSLGYRNKNNNITTITYGDDFNGDKSIHVSHMFHLFNIK